MENNDQILDEFLLEAREIFDQLDIDFVECTADFSCTICRKSNHFFKLHYP
jgi:hypothetical protein